MASSSEHGTFQHRKAIEFFFWVLKHILEEVGRVELTVYVDSVHLNRFVVSLIAFEDGGT